MSYIDISINNTTGQDIYIMEQDICGIIHNPNDVWKLLIDTNLQQSDLAKRFCRNLLLNDPINYPPICQHIADGETKKISFNDDVSTALGSDPLFDSGTALSTAAGSQGVVSGTPSFLDSIATRQAGGASNAERRGLGSRGSGTF